MRGAQRRDPAGEPRDLKLVRTAHVLNDKLSAVYREAAGALREVMSNVFPRAAAKAGRT
jgi:hypothetical protein